MKIVLQKFIAQSGYCSRRKAESFIVNEKVLVNGEIAHLGMRVDENDEVKICGKKIEPETKKKYVILNKPTGYTCTNRSFKNEKNVFNLVKVDERLFVVGRLDKNSRGLVLLTNDGELTQKLTHPSFEHEKEYEVQLLINNLQFSIKDIIKKVKAGIDIGDNDGVVKVKDIRHLGENKFRVILTEGKKRQLRRMFGVLGYRVESLTRVRIGKIELGDLKEGEWKYIKKEEIN